MIKEKNRERWIQWVKIATIAIILSTIPMQVYAQEKNTLENLAMRVFCSVNTLLGSNSCFKENAQEPIIKESTAFIPTPVSRAVSLSALRPVVTEIDEQVILPSVDIFERNIGNNISPTIINRQPIINQNTYPVRERIINTREIIKESGLTQSQFDQQFEALQKDLFEGNQPYDDRALWRALSHTNAIDSLSGVAFSDGTITNTPISGSTGSFTNLTVTGTTTLSGGVVLPGSSVGGAALIDGSITAADIATGVIQTLETTTTLTHNAASGTLSYIDEDGATTTIHIGSTGSTIDEVITVANYASTTNTVAITEGGTLWNIVLDTFTNLRLLGTTVADTITATLGNFDTLNATSTNTESLAVTGTTTLKDVSITGNFALPTSAIIDIVNGGTGTSTVPVSGQVLVGNASGNYDLVDGTTIGTNTNIYNTNGTLSGDREVSLGGNDLGFTGGNIGIGTNAPLSSLPPSRFMEVEYAGDGFPLYRLERAGGTTKINRAWESIIGSSGNYALRDATLAINRFVIDTSGNVGIGTTTPTEKLHVAGTTKTDSLTVGTLTGFLKATAGVVSTGLVNLASDISGTLGITNGGTGTSTAPTNGQVLVGNASGNYDLVDGGTLGTPDNLGNHTATQNIDLGASRLVGNGGTDGIGVSNVGNVGIGTLSNAQKKLHINAGDWDGMLLTHDTDGQVFKIQNDNAGNTWLNTTSNSDLVLRTNNQTQITIKNTGNVGIGTTAPVATLDVNGVIRRGSATYNSTLDSSGLSIFSPSGSSPSLRLSQSGIMDWQIQNVATTGNLTFGGLMDISPAGNIGIGTATPTKKLEVNGQIKSGDLFINPSGAGLAQIGVSGDMGSFANLFNIRSKANVPIAFSTGSTLGSQTQTGTERMRIDGITGNVGIGTTVPAEKLEVNGHVKSGGYGNGFIVNSNGSDVSSWGTPWYGLSLADNADLDLHEGGIGEAVTLQGYYGVGLQSGQGSLVLTANGNVGIGTTAPSEKIFVYNGAFGVQPSTVGTTNDKFLKVFNTVGAERMSFGYDNANIRMHINGNSGTPLLTVLGANGVTEGNIGIGTTAPSAKLEVNGDIKLTGYGNMFYTGDTDTNRLDSTGSGYGRLFNATKTTIQSNGSISLDITGTPKLTVASSGNVGIGTTAPSEKLVVSGEVHPKIRMVSISSAAYYTEFQNNYSAGNPFNIQVIGKNILQVEESAFKTYINGYTGSGLRTTGVTRLYADATGNIGIGTTTPSEKLHVIGNAIISGLVTASTTANVKVDANGKLYSDASDERFKNIAGNFDKSIDALLNIQPITYTWNELSGIADGGIAESGFSAQNLQLSIPEAVIQRNDGYLGLNTKPILATVVNAIKEMWVKITGNTDRVKILEEELCKKDDSYIWCAVTINTNNDLDNDDGSNEGGSGGQTQGTTTATTTGESATSTDTGTTTATTTEEASTTTEEVATTTEEVATSTEGTATSTDTEATTTEETTETATSTEPVSTTTATTTQDTATTTEEVATSSPDTSTEEDAATSTEETIEPTIDPPAASSTATTTETAS